jgi:flagellar biosynthesis protein FlhG
LTIALEHHTDQAAGLRLLLRPVAPRVIAFCSAPRAGRSALCASFAGALTRVGRRVLVLDCADAGAATLLGAAGRPDLLDAARAGLGPREFVAHADAGVAVVRADRAFRSLVQLSARDRERLVRALEAARSESDCVLVDTAGGDLVLAAGCSELVLVMRPHAEGVLESYRLLKRMAPMMAGRIVLILLNRARPGVQSMRFFGNLSATARQFLGMSLEFAGEIPEDESLQRASSLKQPVVDVFPGSPAARAVRGCALGLLGRDNAEGLGVEAFVGRLSAAARTIAAQRAQAR